jgi:hypothetical protein
MTWALDTAVPNVARVYGVLLGGKDNFEADRAAVGKILKLVPAAAIDARENRAFLRRAVGYLAAEAGIRQFLDIGSGLPAMQNVHQVAQQADPPARVVYVDNDPVVISHAAALMASRPPEPGVVRVIEADLLDPGAVIAALCTGRGPVPGGTQAAAQAVGRPIRPGAHPPRPVRAGRRADGSRPVTRPGPGAVH